MTNFHEYTDCEPRRPSGFRWDWMAAVAAWLVVALLAAMAMGHDIPTAPVHVPQADIIERNHLVSPDTGNECFQQFIWWGQDWQGYSVRDWRMAVTQAYLAPSGMWRVTVSDGECLYQIDARTFVETWAIEDPEVLARNDLPECERVRLGDFKRKAAR